MYWFAFYNNDRYYSDAKEYIDGITIYKGNKDDILDYAWQGGLTDTNVTFYYKTKRELIIELIYQINIEYSKQELFEIPYSKILIKEKPVIDLRDQ